MKAEELMVGDWVLYTEFGRNKKCKVEILEPNRVWLNGCRTYVPIEFIAPIPLTPELLERNGFVIKKKWAQLGNFGDSPLIMWHFEDDKFLYDYRHELEIHQNDTGKVHIQIQCDYVHQLQQLFRLVGINKEITLDDK